MAEATIDSTPKPAPEKMGEQSGAQVAAFCSGALATNLPGYNAPSSATYALFDEMDRDPTIALAQAIVGAAVLMTPWAYQVKEGVPDDRVGWVREQFDQRREELLGQCLNALRRGWQPFEKIFDVAKGKIVLRRLKPLLPELTRVIVDDHGKLVGLDQPNISREALPLGKVFVYSYAKLGDNWYGRSRHLAAQAAYEDWKKTNDNAGKLSTKAAGIVVHVTYPTNYDAVDDKGKKVAGWEAAKKLAEMISSGQSAITPNFFAAEENVRSAAELADKTAFKVDLLELGDVGGALSGAIEERRYKDSQKLRAWLVLERAATEGQFGTKAEAETHGDLVMLICDLLHREITRWLSWYVLDDLLEWNWGQEARGSVWIEPGSSSDSQKGYLRGLVNSLLSNPATTDLLVRALDLDSLLDETDTPKSAEVIDLGDLGAMDPNAPAGVTPEQQSQLSQSQPPDPAAPAPAPAQPSDQPGKGGDQPSGGGADIKVGALQAALDAVKAFYAGEINRAAAIAFLVAMCRLDRATAEGMCPEEKAVDLTATAGQVEPGKGGAPAPQPPPQQSSDQPPVPQPKDGAA